jgi:hypothetical protein
MFNRGITQLLDALPELPELDPERIRRLLSMAYLDAVERRDLLGNGSDLAALRSDLRRLATALELHVVLVDDLTWEARRASAFVAAEVLDVLAEAPGVDDDRPETALGSTERYQRIEAGLLYLAAGFDANAAVAEHGLGDREAPGVEAAAAERALLAIRALLRGARAVPAVDDEIDLPPTLIARVRVALWERIGRAVRTHIAWLRGDDVQTVSSAVRELRDLEQLLAQTGPIAHRDIHHLLVLLLLACDATGARAALGSAAA